MPATSPGLRAYLDQIGRISLLTAEQEVELSAQMAAGRIAAARLADQPSGADADDLRTVVERGHAARAAMASANLRLVVSIARRYVHCGLSIGDLVQEGNIGLMRAVDRFDGTLGFRFSTYASAWISQAIGTAVGEDRLVRLPPKVRAEVVATSRCRDRLWERLGRTPHVSEVAAELGIDEVTVQRRLRADVRLVWLDDPVTGRRAAPDDRDTPDQVAHRRLVGEQVGDELVRLSAAERAVVEARYGIGGPPTSIVATADRLDLSVAAVRTLERQAFAVLRDRPALQRLAGGGEA